MIRGHDEESQPQERPWYLLTGLVLGLVIGLILSLAVFPLRYTDTTPAMLEETARNDYIIAIALAHYGTPDIGRARARLQTLGLEGDLAVVVRSLSTGTRWGDGFTQVVEALNKLASDLSDGAMFREDIEILVPEGEDTPEPTDQSDFAPTYIDEAQPVSGGQQAGSQSEVGEVANDPDELAEDFLQPPENQVVLAMTINDQPFRLAERLTFCDRSMSSQLEVVVTDESGQGLKGVPILIQWADGTETFFTGLYGEIGAGYADYDMQEGEVYQLQVGRTSLFVEDVKANICREDDGTLFSGGIRLVFEPQS
jgi:hypothetical protein